MRLCDRDIEIWLNEGSLSIEPRPSIDHINGVTVDIHLGNKFRTFRNNQTTPFIDLSWKKYEIDAMLDCVMSDEIFIDKDKTFCLYPGELALAITFESVTLPSNLVGWLDGRSSLARLGLMIHITAHRIDPGWSGCIVLEFFNAGKLPLGLRPGMIVGALSFETLTRSSDRPYNRRHDAQYHDQYNIMTSSFSKIDY